MEIRTCIKGCFYHVHAFHYIQGVSVHTRCLMSCLLGSFSLVWTPMCTKLWGFHVSSLRTCFIYWLCILHTLPHMCISHALFIHCTQSPHAHTFATLVMPWSISCFLILSMLCLLYALQHLVFVFCFSFIPHSCCTPYTYYPCSYLHLFPSFFLTPLSIRVKKGESILKSIVISI